MLNKKIIIGISLFYFISCKVHEKDFYNTMYKTKLGTFFLFDKKLNYIYRVDKTDNTIVYHIKGNLIKLNNYNYLTENETYESALVNSKLEKIELTEKQKEKINLQLENDTIKFSKDFKELDYNGIIYTKYKK